MEYKEDIRSVLYKGNLYWMPKLELEVLIKEFLDDLTLNHPMIGFKYTREELIDKWKKRGEKTSEDPFYPCGKKKDEKSVLIYQSRMSGKNTMVIDTLLKWLDTHKKEVKKIIIEFI